jgi:hypothetical protein
MNNLLEISLSKDKQNERKDIYHHLSMFFAVNLFNAKKYITAHFA